ncbi:metacaspase-1-like [Vicia villosa]|uniref:metacaspase-1-like n=1 Tax=Vicia villosa TaxID=3911 RepID=UPI00273CE66A|nr:metacaspase-1-like [Vicia villosa]
MATRRGRCCQCGRAIQVEAYGYANSMAMMCSGCRSQGFSQQPNCPFVNNNSNSPPPPAAYGRRPSWPHTLMGPQAPMTPPSPYGNKRAVLFGISYGNSATSLKGSLNDVHSMKYFLTQKLGFPTDCVRMLTDEPGERNPMRIPTKYNMRMAMKWLVEGCQAGDSLVLHFSGHGSRQVDHGMDEVDGYDEAICPVDYEREGKILDDEINATIVRPLPYGAKLHAVTDTCFSGTVLDLPFMCRMNRKGYYGWEDHRSHRAGYKGTRGGLAVCISACDDDGSAADTSAFSGMESAGALTYSFIQAMQVERKLTYGQLLNAMRSSIRGAREGMFGPNQQQHVMETRQTYAHDPQLSSSEKFDIYSKTIAI